MSTHPIEPTSVPLLKAAVIDRRPNSVKRFRLLNQQDEFFPPLGQIGFNAWPYIDRPCLPASIYTLQFEDEDGNVIGERLPVRIVDPSDPALPDDRERYRTERRAQKIDAREYALQRKATTGSALTQVAALLIESQRNAAEMQRYSAETLKEAQRDNQRNLTESQKHIAENHQLMMKMVADFSGAQKAVIEQLNELVKQTRDMQPPKGENWSGALGVAVEAAKAIVLTGMMANAEPTRRGSEKGMEAAKKQAPRIPAQSADSSEATQAPSSVEPGAGPSLAAPTPSAPSQGAQSTDRADADASPSASAGSSSAPSQEPPQSAAKEALQRTRLKLSAPTLYAPADAEQDLEVQEEEQEGPASQNSPLQAAWREMKRRIVNLTGPMMAWILANKENFVDWLQYIANARPQPPQNCLAEVEG